MVNMDEKTDFELCYRYHICQDTTLWWQKVRCCFTRQGTNETIVDVLEGKDFSRVCNQSQYPDNKVFWTKNSTSESFIVHGADLNFTDIHRQQTGEYLCQAHDDISNTNVTLDDIYVNVLCK